jgi:hypothetical protein
VYNSKLYNFRAIGYKMKQGIFPEFRLFKIHLKTGCYSHQIDSHVGRDLPLHCPVITEHSSTVTKPNRFPRPLYYYISTYRDQQIEEKQHIFHKTRTTSHRDSTMYEQLSHTITSQVTRWIIITA